MPTIAELFDLALRFHQSGQASQAELLCRQILAVDHAQQAVYHLLGILAKEAGRRQEAIALIRRAIELNPNIAGFHYNLGLIHQSQGEWVDAEACFRQALYLDALQPRVHRNLGVALFQQGKTAEAADGFRQALLRDPNDLDAHNNLGLILAEQRQLAAAAECYRQALRIDPRNQAALLNRALLRLLQGDFESGWPDFECRRVWPGTKERFLGQPRWDGAPMDGKTILVYAEQGLGDTIMFARFLPLVKQHCGKVVLECQTALHGIMAGLGIDEIVSPGAPLPPFDTHIPLLSLPGLLGCNLDTIPKDIPYLYAEQTLVRRWQQDLEPDRGRALQVGIVWQGNPYNSMDRLRSVPLRCFEAFTRVSGVRLISLQVGPGKDQLVAASFPVVDVGSRFDPDSLDDLAATLMNLDLVVTVCTSVAHLAGALGVPTWVALSYSSDWRWLLDRSDSPWYSTLRLFRQPRPGDWQAVFGEMTDGLQLLSAGKTRSEAES
jgi:Flp pilus assembly protein TadD